jgi:hypothetical protein
VPAHKALGSVFENTTLGVSFIRGAILSSDVGQYGDMSS